jgi:ketosteroid isomerase-like protein
MKWAGLGGRSQGGEGRISEQNVEIVRRAFDAVRHIDHEGAAQGFHADAMWHNTAEFPGQRVCVGPEAIIDFWKTLMESFEERGSMMEIERVVEGEDSVVVGVHSVARGKASGIPLDFHWSAAFHVRDGKISRVDVHGDWAKALNAAGLAE